MASDQPGPGLGRTGGVEDHAVHQLEDGADDPLRGAGGDAEVGAERFGVGLGQIADLLLDSR